MESSQPLSRTGFRAHSDVPRVWWCRRGWFSGHGLGGLVQQFELYGRAQPESGVTPVGLWKIFQVLEDRIGQLDKCSPLLASNRPSAAKHKGAYRLRMYMSRTGRNASGENLLIDFINRYNQGLPK